MKYLFALGAAAILIGGATAPALAARCTMSTTYQKLNNLPPECLLSDTKDKHPLWYRDGGYCAGCTTVTQSVSTEGCFDIV